MAGYVKWLAPQYEVIRARLRAEVAQLRDQAMASDSHARTPEIVANLAIGLRYFLAFAVDCGAISQDQAGQFWIRGWSALREAAAAQAGHHGDAEPTERFLRLVVSAIASGREHLASADGHVPEDSPRACG
jgi:hypothetical protein